MTEPRRFFIHTFGCRCNQADSAALRDGLCQRSLVEAQDSAEADLVIVNSCTVTHRTDQQVRQAVRKVRRENPHVQLVVTGCYAERDPQSLARLSGVSLVVGNAGRDQLPDLILERAPDDPTRVVRSPLASACDFHVPSMSLTGGKTRPLIKLQDGCDARCSYCIVPAVRGPGRSAVPRQVLQEVRALVDRGYQEIVLTGVHLGSYGRRLANPTSLVALLAQIAQIPGLGRVRLSSIEPMRFSRRIVDLVAASSVFAHHFHIPLQSGSDPILRRMRRPYTAARYLSLLSYIVERIRDVGLGTDVLVGFPGETAEDFRRTCDVIRRSPLTYLHVFPFSPREGTDAWAFGDRVSPIVVRDRVRILRELSEEKSLEFRRRLIGRELDAVTLAKEEAEGESVALTGNYIHCRIPGHGVPPNRLVRVRIDRMEAGATYATII